METPMEEDPRNGLYKLYARFLKKYQPRMFVFENVMGIESANGGKTYVVGVKSAGPDHKFAEEGLQYAEDDITTWPDGVE